MTHVDEDFEALLVHLREARGFDFTGYKRSSLMRRVRLRMGQIGMETYADYLDHLLVHPDEFTVLFNTILINVTSFFRDAEAWEQLRTVVLPAIIEERGPDAPIRVWSAGCASGQEAYSLAIAMAEALGPDEFRRRVKIYATDLDEEGLAQARQAAYSDREIRGIPDDLRDRYFEQNGSRYTFRKDLRRTVIFGRNDLVQDAPISRIDLLVCRNTLMYFNAETQGRILTRFHFALADAGVLFLGKAEMLLGHTGLFQPMDLKRRMFRKAPSVIAFNTLSFSEIPTSGRALPSDRLDRIRNEAFMAGPVAEIVVALDGVVATLNRQAESLFGLSARDVGRSFRDLDVSYRPMELRAFIEQVHAERRAARIKEIDFARSPGEVIHLEIQVIPLSDSEGTLLGVTIFFHDVTAAHRLRTELEYANRQLETAYEELQSTNEELETTNEELQSTVEELETTNEELQSTNEELETMNEELQSTNDELQTINDELRERSAELDESNAFLQAILTSLWAGVVVVNRDMHVQVWNSRAEDLWGLRHEEAVGQHLLNLDIGLPVDQIRPYIRQVLTDGQPRDTAVPAVNRRGREVVVRVVVTPLPRAGEVGAVMLVMDVEDKGPPAI